MNTCPFCGARLSETGRFCTSCGKALNLGVSSNGEKAKEMLANDSSKRPITDECVIEASKIKMLGILLLSIGFVALGVFMIAKQKSVNPAFIVGILSVLVFGTFAVCAIVVLFKPRVGLILNSRGFEYMSTGTKSGFVLWEEVEGYRVQEMVNQKMLIVLLKNPEAFVQRLHGLAKAAGNASLKLAESPIGLVSSGLAIDFQELVNLFARYCKLYVTSARVTDDEAAKRRNDRQRPASGRTAGEGDVFLHKVQVAQALKEAEEENSTPEERQELRKVRELFAAGEEALRAGNESAGERWFSETEAALGAWWESVEVWKEREREEAQERIEREAREQAERVSKRWKAVKVLGVAAVVLLVGAGVWTGVQKGVELWRIGAIRRILATPGQEAGETRTIPLPGGATMSMVWCPAGSFTMGSPGDEKDRNNNERQHRVTLTQGFWLAKTEVTQKQWQSVMGNNPSYLWGDDLPVERVSWYACEEFCRKTELRLPTEAEWEYACRAGSEGPCAGTGRLNDMGWFSGNSSSRPHPVGEKQANAWGLHDMHGNIWEWCEDWLGRYPSEPVTDPLGPAWGGSRVLRGGGWDNRANYCRSANRGFAFPESWSYNFGFRPCASAGLH